MGEVPLRRPIKKAFADCDEDLSGKISLEEFRARAHSPEMQVYFKAINVDVSEVDKVFYLLDADEDGNLNFEEFTDRCLRLRGNAKAIDFTVFVDEVFRMHQRHFNEIDDIKDQL